MKRYQYVNEDKTSVYDSENFRIFERQNEACWSEFQDWMSKGNTTDDLDSGDRLVPRKVSRASQHAENIKARARRKADYPIQVSLAAILGVATGTPTNKQKRYVARITTVATFIEDVDKMLKSTIVWLEDPVRTRDELKQVVINDLEWPEVPTFGTGE